MVTNLWMPMNNVLTTTIITGKMTMMTSIPLPIMTKIVRTNKITLLIACSPLMKHHFHGVKISCLGRALIIPSGRNLILMLFVYPNVNICRTSNWKWFPETCLSANVGIAERWKMQHLQLVPISWHELLAIIWAYYHVASPISHRDGLFEYGIYTWDGLHCIFK